MAIYQGNNELTLNNVSTVKHGGVTVYSKKIKVIFYNYYYMDGFYHDGYYIIPPFDTSKFKEIKFNYIKPQTNQKLSAIVTIDKYKEALDNYTGFLIGDAGYYKHTHNITISDMAHYNLSGSRWGGPNSMDSLIQSMQLLN